MSDLAGSVTLASNDHRDLRLLASLSSRAVTHLVTNDQRLRKWAIRVALAENTYSVAEAIQFLRQLVPYEAPPPPLVSRIQAYTLDTGQRILDSLREEYAPDFDKWLDKVRDESQHRPCFIVTVEDEYAGLALLKHEDDADYELEKPIVKISTFKVDPDRSGSKYGELLLKSIFMYAYQQRVASLYVTIFAHHESLRALLGEFGFAELPGVATGLGELVMAKTLRGSRDSGLPPLEYHKRYGPPAILIADQSAWAIPIVPHWHDQLFPDAPAEEDPQLTLPGLDEPDPKPWGNALRKAYLCRSNIASISAGDSILFYRSHDTQAFTVVGVVEDTLRSRDPTVVMSFVGKRTVYTPSDIAEMCRRGPVLAILFRQDRFVEPPWNLADAVGNGLLKSHPQSITKVREEGVPWLRQGLAEWP
jgi:GNAT superfamily N-acetyltransferase